MKNNILKKKCTITEQKIILLFSIFFINFIYFYIIHNIRKVKKEAINIEKVKKEIINIGTIKKETINILTLKKETINIGKIKKETVNIEKVNKKVIYNNSLVIKPYMISKDEYNEEYHNKQNKLYIYFLVFVFKVLKEYNS